MTKPKTKPTDEASLFTGPAVKVEPATKPKQEVAVRSKKSGGEITTDKPAEIVPMNGLLAVLSVFERLAVNPNVNPDSLGKLLDVQERLLAKQAQMAFDAAMVEMIPELPVITRDGRIIVQEKDARTGKRTGDVTQNTPYAKWEKIVPLIKPVLHRHGFVLTHRSETSPTGRLRVTAVLKGHGHTDDKCYMDLEADTSGSKNNAQGWASALSYAKRHTAAAVLNIVTKDDDDDGKASGRPVVVGEPLSPEQLEKLIDFCGAVECSEKHLIKHLNQTKPVGHPDLTRIADLPASRFEQAIKDLESYDANKRARDAKPAAETVAR